MDKINQIKFKIGFWHPFGPHGCKPNGEIENPKEIIKRKNDEMRKNGWTLWSFQSRASEGKARETINKWRKEINKYNPKERVFVLCSDSKGTAKAPSGKIVPAEQYQFVGSNEWIDMPSAISIPHPFGKRNMALAFKVKAIYKPEEIKLPEGIKWFRKDRMWREDKLPTRPEYLIKSGGKCKLREVYQILELEHPYLAVLRK